MIDGVIHVNATLAEIKDFIHSCKKKIDRFAGVNVLISKRPGWSYIVAKSENSFRAQMVLPIFLDYANPVHRPVIANAINQAMYGKDMEPEDLEKQMIEVVDKKETKKEVNNNGTKH